METAQIMELLHQQLKPVYAYCLRRCASVQDAKDVAQEILLRALHRLARTAPADPLRYLWCIARNTLINHYRSRSRCSVGIPAEMIDHSHFENGLLAQEETRQLHEELSRLGQQQRQIVVMFYFHGMKQQQIASALSLPVGTVKWHLFEARKELKKQMSHPRDMSHLKFDPIHFSAFGIEGSISTEGSPWRVFRSSMAQNIAYSCWREGRTVAEIADALGVSPVYVEDEMTRMAEQHYLEQENDRYRCAILLTEWTDELIRLADKMYTEAAACIAPALFDALSCRLLTDPDIHCPEGCNPSYPLWALIPWVISNLPRQGVSFQDVASIRPDGAHNLCHAAITPPGVPQPSLADRMERFSGPCWNVEDGVSLWQIDTIWSEERISETYQMTESRILRLLRRMLLQGETLSAAEYSDLVLRGVIRAANGPEGQLSWGLQSVWLRGKAVQDRLLALGADVFRLHADTLEALRCPYASALMADTPQHLRRLREYLLDSVFRSDRFILHCLNHLVESGRLLLPSDAERHTLHTMILTD